MGGAPASDRRQQESKSRHREEFVMEKNELRDRLAAGRLTRRQFARAAAAAGVGLVTLPLLARHGAADTG
jgi:hypothetical protein